jgi:hypothetical protein
MNSQLDVEAAAEGLDHLLRLAGTQQAVVDEDAGELLADRLVDQHRRHRRVHAAGQAADHPRVADLLAYAFDLHGAEPGHAPGAAAAGNLMGEVAQQRRAVRRVHHLWMEHQAVQPASLVGDDGERRALADRDRPETRRQPADAVTVAHPHLLAPAALPDALQQGGVLQDIDMGAAELAMVRR